MCIRDRPYLTLPYPTLPYRTLPCHALPCLTCQIYFYQNAEGTGLSPFDSWLLLRGVKTMHLRVQKQQENAIRVARFLKAHPCTTHVRSSGSGDSVVVLTLMCVPLMVSFLLLVMALLWYFSCCCFPILLQRVAIILFTAIILFYGGSG